MGSRDRAAEHVGGFALRYRDTPAVRALLTRAPLVLDRGRAGLEACVA